MAEKKINPHLITRIQDRRGKTIYNFDKKRKCQGCERLKLMKMICTKYFRKKQTSY